MVSLVRLLRSSESPGDAAMRYAVAVFQHRRVYQKRLEAWLEEQRRLRGVCPASDPANPAVQEGQPADPTPNAALWEPRWPDAYPPEMRKLRHRLNKLNAALAELDPKTRTMLVLYAEHGKDIPEIARRFGITCAAVYSRFKTAERVFRRLGRRLTL